MATSPSTPASPRGPVTVAIDWDALELSVERNAPDSDSYLDLSTGAVVSVVAGEPDTAIVNEKIAANIRGYLRVEPASSREQYRWMEKFVGSVADEALRERLIISIDGKGAFRRFKDVLLGFPVERERWFSYRANLLHWHIQCWLEEQNVTPANPPPWGKVEAPAELEPVPGKPVVHGTEPPGEALRRHARELLEQMPAIELPSAIAFLEFLVAREQKPRDTSETDEPEARRVLGVVR